MPIYGDLDDLNNPDHFLERCRRDFEATGNPLHMWEAWGAWRAWARKRDIKLPDWLASYFDRCADRLLSESGPSPATGEEIGAIGRAFGFTQGLGTSRRGYGGRWDSNERLAAQAIEKMWHEGLRLDAAATAMDSERFDAPAWNRMDELALKLLLGEELSDAQRRDFPRLEMQLRGKTQYFPPPILATQATIKAAVRGAKRWALRTMQGRLREANGSVPPGAQLVLAYSRLCGERGKARKAALKSDRNRRVKPSGA